MKIWILLCPLVVFLSSCNLAPLPVEEGVMSPQVEVPAPQQDPVVVVDPAPVTKSKNIALVYDGPGACPEDCSKASADTARLAGFTPKMVGPNALTANSTPQQIADLFKDVAIWVQPGGKSRDAYLAMTPTLRNSLISFIKDGGGYVGFCAGAFITTKWIGTTGVQGFGIFPGSTAPLGTGSHRETVTWQGKTREIYFEGGPYMYNVDSSVEVTAYYDDVAVRVANSLKHQVVGFSILGDAGATYTAKKVETAFLAAKKGEIAIVHFNHPESQTREGVIRAITKLKEQGFKFVKLSDYPLK